MITGIVGVLPHLPEVKNLLAPPKFNDSLLPKWKTALEEKKSERQFPAS
jgi:hypothetical protein